MDRVRNQRIQSADIQLETLGRCSSWFGLPSASCAYTTIIADEAFTSENWIVRIYEVKKPDELGRPHVHSQRRKLASNNGPKPSTSKIPKRRVV